MQLLCLYRRVDVIQDQYHNLSTYKLLKNHAVTVVYIRAEVVPDHCLASANKPNENYAVTVRVYCIAWWKIMQLLYVYIV